MKYWERINWSARHTFHAVRDDKRIWFFVALDNETVPQHAFVYNLQTHRVGGMGQWWVYKYKQSFIDSGNHGWQSDTVADAIGVAGTRAALAMSISGHMYWLGVGLRDGASLRHGLEHTSGERTRTATCTVQSGTATQIVCDSSTYKFEDTFQSKTRNVVGTFIKFTNVPELPGYYEVTGVSGASDNQLDFAAGTFTGYTFTGSEQFLLAPIPDVEWHSGLLDFGDASVLKSVDEVYLEFDPVAIDTQLAATHVRNRLGKPDQAFTVDEVGHTATAGDDYEYLKLGGKVATDGGRGYAIHKIKGRDLHQMKFILGNGEAVVDMPAVIHGVDFRLI